MSEQDKSKFSAFLEKRKDARAAAKAFDDERKAKMNAFYENCTTFKYKVYDSGFFKLNDFKTVEFKAIKNVENSTLTYLAYNDLPLNTVLIDGNQNLKVINIDTKDIPIELNGETYYCHKAKYEIK